MENQKQTTAKELLEQVVQVLKENLVAIFEKEGEDLIIRSLGGERFRLTIQMD